MLPSQKKQESDSPVGHTDRLRACLACLACASSFKSHGNMNKKRSLKHALMLRRRVWGDATMRGGWQEKRERERERGGGKLRLESVSSVACARDRGFYLCCWNLCTDSGARRDRGAVMVSCGCSWNDSGLMGCSGEG